MCRWGKNTSKIVSGKESYSGRTWSDEWPTSVCEYSDKGTGGWFEPPAPLSGYSFGWPIIQEKRPSESTENFRRSGFVSWFVIVVVCWYVSSRTWDTRRGRELMFKIVIFWARQDRHVMSMSRQGNSLWVFCIVGFVSMHFFRYSQVDADTFFDGPLASRVSSSSNADNNKKLVFISDAHFDRRFIKSKLLVPQEHDARKPLSQLLTGSTRHLVDAPLKKHLFDRLPPGALYFFRVSSFIVLKIVQRLVELINHNSPLTPAGTVEVGVFTLACGRCGGCVLEKDWQGWRRWAEDPTWELRRRQWDPHSRKVWERAEGKLSGPQTRDVVVKEGKGYKIVFCGEKRRLLVSSFGGFSAHNNFHTCSLQHDPGRLQRRQNRGPIFFISPIGRKQTRLESTTITVSMVVTWVRIAFWKFRF